jgi:putative MATE family efflux protein
MTVPVLAYMMCQATWYLVDLYFVADLGRVALAGVAMSANITFIVVAIIQVLSVGTVAPISQAIGRGDLADAALVFGQGLMLSILTAVVILASSLLLTPFYVQALGADKATMAAASEYLQWFMPGLALSLPLSALASALRGAGVVRPTMVVYSLTVLVNVILAPILIAGWGTGHALGVAGAGLATSISMLVGVLIMVWYCRLHSRWISLGRTHLSLRFTQVSRILRIGVPAGGESAFMFLYIAVAYWALRGFGPAAQAGFGLGSRVSQILLIPALAVSFAAGPIVGQNFGAGRLHRVREILLVSAGLSIGAVVLLAAAAWISAEELMSLLTSQRDVIEMGAAFVRATILSLVARAVVGVCSSLFQGLGYTRPALISAAIALGAFVGPLLIEAQQDGFRTEDIWMLWNGSMVLQSVVSLMLLRGQFGRRLVVVN